MILYCNFEELAALSAAVARTLDLPAMGHAVLAPAEAMPDLEALLPRLSGDITIESLTEHASVHRAVAFITDELRTRLDAVVIDQHPAAEDAVMAYFDFAHSLSVLNRLEVMGREMEAIAALVTGQNPTSEAAQRFTFSDE